MAAIFYCPADALPCLLHALMLLSALVVFFFLRSVIPAYVCFTFALMPLCSSQWHVLICSTACPCCLLLHHVQGARFCHLFPLLLLMLPTAPRSDAFIGSCDSLFSCVRLFLHIPALRSLWCHCTPYSGIFSHAPPPACSCWCSPAAPRSDDFIGSYSLLFPAVGYSCICLLYVRSDALVFLTVAYSDMFHRLPLLPAPADALQLLHAIMPLLALVACFFLRSVIPAYACFTLYLMPLYGLQWHILTRSTVCRPAPASRSRCQILSPFPLLLLMLS